MPTESGKRTADVSTGVVRLRLDLGYDGSEFSGWALQPGRRTVQGVVEGALSLVLRTGRLPLTVAGRTDAGVHARGQVCHVDVAPCVAEHELPRLARRLNRLLPADVRVRRVSEAPAGFDARFSAVSRRYVYRVCDDPCRADPLSRNQVLSWPHRLDVDAMNQASAALCGEHDFASFCKRREGATTVRRLLHVSCERSGDVVVATLVADAFCHHMVRSIVGCLLAVGEGRRPTGWPGQVLARRRRDPGVRVVQARGLTLEEVVYPPDEELAARASQARSVRVVQ